MTCSRFQPGKMHACLTIAAIFVVFLTANASWLSPPGQKVEWSLPEMNFTWDKESNVMHVVMMENYGTNEWNWERGRMPFVEFLYNKNDSERVRGVNGWTSMDLEQYDGRWYYSIEHPMDADGDKDFWSIRVMTLPDQIMQSVRLTVIDYNDEIPQWENGDFSKISHEVEETEDWGDEGDSASSSRRQITELTFSDADKIMTRFSIEKDNPDCRKVLSKAICDEVLELIEVDVPYEIVGRALVRRTKGQKIDLDDRRLFDGDSNEHHYLLTVWDTDKTNSITSNFTMIVKKRDD